MGWSIQYLKKYREYAKAKGTAMAALGFVTAEGQRFETVGHVSPRGLAYLRRALKHFQKIEAEEG